MAIIPSWTDLFIICCGANWWPSRGCSSVLSLLQGCDVVTKCPPGTRGVWAPLVSVGTVWGSVSPRKGRHYHHGRDPGGEVKVMTDLGVTASWWLELKCLREKVKWEEQWAERGILSQQQHWKLEGAQGGAVKRHLHRGEGCVTEAEQRSGVSEMRKWTWASKATDGFSEIGTGEFPLDLEVRSLWP